MVLEPLLQSSGVPHLSSLVFLHVIHCHRRCQNHHCHHDYSISKTTALPPPPLPLLRSDNKSHHQKGLSPICSPMKTHLHWTIHASWQYHHVPPHITNLLHAPSRARSTFADVIHYVIYTTLALSDVITAMSSSWRHYCHVIAYVIRRLVAYVILWLPPLTFCSPSIP